MTLMGNVGNIDKVPNRNRAGKQLKYKIYLLSEDQVNEAVGFPARVGREIPNIPLSAGEYWHYAGAVKDSPEMNWQGEEGEIATTITDTLKFVVGGMPDNMFDLLEEGVGEGFYPVVVFCATGDKYIGGNGCKPMILSSFEGGSTKDNTSTTLNFKRESGFTWSKYTGNTPEQAAETVAADAVTIGLTSNPQYQLSDGSSAPVVVTGFTGVDDSDVGRIVTVLGSGGNNPPTIDAGNDFLLVGGVQWEALAGAQISFKIFKDGAGSYKFVEVPGSRQ